MFHQQPRQVKGVVRRSRTLLMDDQTTDSQERFLEVIGGYDEDFGDPPTRRPLPADAVPILRELKDSEQIRRYLINLPNALMLQNYRHIQYRNLEDGSLQDFHGYGSFKVNWDGPQPIDTCDVVPLPTPGGEYSIQNLPPVRTVGELLRQLEQLPPAIPLQCAGKDFVQVTVCKNGEQYIARVEESRGPDAEPCAAEDGGV
ncbi:MAG: hypothetical protein NT069_20335 [Planctomycetota bacterium]|nr:hypothetical protein [Planctomycetota bacterium]